MSRRILWLSSRPLYDGHVGDFYNQPIFRHHTLQTRSFEHYRFIENNEVCDFVTLYERCCKN